MQIFARSATESDGEVLELLETEARSGLDHFRGGTRLADDMDLDGTEWSIYLADDSIKIFVAGTNEVVMGYLLARVGKAKSGAIATIERVFVTKDARNFGIGDALVTAIIDWAKSVSLVALDGLALPGDRETKNLYERSGLVARLITVTINLKV